MLVLVFCIAALAVAEILVHLGRYCRRRQEQKSAPEPQAQVEIEAVEVYIDSAGYRPFFGSLDFEPIVQI